MNKTVIDMSKTSDRRDVATVSDATTLIQVIERAARDPNVDIDRMDRLLQMHERMTAKQAEKEYAESLARLQPKLPIIQERGSIRNSAGSVQSKYALWEDIVGIITPILATEGFSLSFRIAHPDNKIEVTGVLTHERGHGERTAIILPADTSGSKNAVQAVASSVSYGKRYTAGALLNLRTGELDDDALTATTGPKVNKQQIEQIERRMQEACTDRARFLEFWQIESVDQLPEFNFAPVMALLDKAAKRIDPRPDLSAVDTTLRDKRVSEITDLIAEYGSDENQLAAQLQAYHQEYLQPFPELWIAINDKLAADKIVSKANMKKLLSLVLKPS